MLKINRVRKYNNKKKTKIYDVSNFFRHHALSSYSSTATAMKMTELAILRVMANWVGMTRGRHARNSGSTSAKRNICT